MSKDTTKYMNTSIIKNVSKNIKNNINKNARENVNNMRDGSNNISSKKEKGNINQRQRGKWQLYSHRPENQKPRNPALAYKVCAQCY